MAATAVAINVANSMYYYNSGVYYEPVSGGYTVVAAPPGATISVLPSGCSPVIVSGTTYYYYGGTFYAAVGQGYQVVSPPQGAIVDQLPSGAVEVQQNGITYLKYNGTLYQPVQDNGEDAYQVMQ